MAPNKIESPEVTNTSDEHLHSRLATSYMLVRKDSTEEFKDLLFFVTFRTVELNSGITVNQLKWLLQTQFRFESEEVEAAVAALSNTNALGLISVWYDDNSAGHLRVRRNDAKFNVTQQAWMSLMLEKYPNFSEIEPPLFRKKQREQHT
jgi:hypothetical protein